MASIINNELTLVKTVTNNSLEDYINDLTLDTLDISGGTLDVTGTTVIGGSSLIPDPLTVDTINQATVAGLIIENTVTNVNVIGSADVQLSALSGDVALISADEITIAAGGTGAVTATADSTININTTGATTPGGHSILMATQGDGFDDIRIGGSGRVTITHRRNGGNATSCQSTNAGQNAFTTNADSRIVYGCHFFGTINAGTVDTDVIFFSTTPNFLARPVVIATSNDSRIQVATNLHNLNNFELRARNDTAGAINNVRVQWMAIGDSN